MNWNWESADWPEFSYDQKALETFELQLQREAGVALGALKHLDQQDRDDLKVTIVSTEALKTSEIEGEYLNRESLQSSIRRAFGLTSDNRRSSPAETGIAEMMVDLYRSYNQPLSQEMLFEWHIMLCKGRRDLMDVGQYRTHQEDMQIVSAGAGEPKVYYIAPPSVRVPEEMEQFVRWFNQTSPSGDHPLPGLTRSGVAHIYFESIHPFEDGNGRIGRAISEKALAQALGYPTLIALGYEIERKRKYYYQAIQRVNRTLEITSWLGYFAKTVLAAQQYSQTQIEFLIEKSKLYDRVGERLNARQAKVLERMFREGPDGFKGGLSAENYIKITDASRATATRDLQELVKVGAFRKEGELRYTRYYLNLNHPIV